MSEMLITHGNVELFNIPFIRPGSRGSQIPISKTFGIALRPGVARSLGSFYPKLAPQSGGLAGGFGRLHAERLELPISQGLASPWPCLGCRRTVPQACRRGDGFEGRPRSAWAPPFRPRALGPFDPGPGREGSGWQARHNRRNLAETRTSRRVAVTMNLPLAAKVSRPAADRHKHLDREQKI